MTDPLNWEQLEKQIKSGVQLDRTFEVYLSYERHLKHILDSGITIYEYVYKHIFADGRRYALTVNNYRYNLEPDIYHYVFWINPNIEMSLTESMMILENLLDEFLYKDNPIEIKSVKNINHYHVFSKMKPSCVEGLLQF